MSVKLAEDDKIATLTQKTVDQVTVSGITVADIDDTTKRSLNVFGGVRVEKISSGRSANSKMIIGDVITQTNGKPVYSKNDFKKLVSQLADKSLANVLVYRNNTPLFIALKISKWFDVSMCISII